jgi:hypothetical protein
MDSSLGRELAKGIITMIVLALVVGVVAGAGLVYLGAWLVRHLSVSWQ